MNREMHLTAEKVYEKEFHVTDVGFKCVEVDRVLDQVIEDYQTYEEKIAELKHVISKYEVANRVLQEQIDIMKANIEENKNRVSLEDEIEARVRKLEAKVFKK